MEMWHFVLKIAILCQIIFVKFGLSQTQNQSMVINNATLIGGPRHYEGLVTVKVADQWLNLCAVDGRILSGLEDFVCGSNTNNGKPAWYVGNVFHADQMQDGIELTHCHKSSSGRINCTANISNCSSVVSMCCNSSMDPIPNRGGCSASWAAALQRKIHHRFTKPSIAQIRDYPYNDTGQKDIQLSWTKYAVKVVGNHRRRHGTKLTKVGNIVVIDTIRSCANDGLNKLMTTTAHDENKPYVCAILTKRLPCPEANINFKLIMEQNRRVLFCVAVKVVNGRPLLEVLNCSTYLPSFVQPTRDQIGSTTPQSEPVLTNDDDTNDNSVVIVLVTLIVLVAAVLVICLVYKCIKYRRRGDSVSNFMNNETYFRSVREKDDAVEEYALISDMEVSTSVVERYKPPLPKRDGGTDPRDQQEVVTIDDYSLPKDSLPESEIDLVYTNTYDDPIRMKLKRNTSSTLENKSRTSSKDLSATSKQVNENKVSASESYEEVVPLSKQLSGHKQVTGNKMDVAVSASYEEVVCGSKYLSDNKKFIEIKHDITANYEDVECISKGVSKDLSDNKQVTETKLDAGIGASYEDTACASKCTCDNKASNETKQDITSSYEDVAHVIKDNMSNTMPSDVAINSSNTKEQVNETPRNSNSE